MLLLLVSSKKESIVMTILIELRVEITSSYFSAILFTLLYATADKQELVIMVSAKRGDDAKRLKLYLPITSRSARLPEPFDPRIAKTSPP